MTTATRPSKPLGIKAYGHIAHLPGSRMGPGDHHCHPGQARIATERARDRNDVVIVQEKLDGSCVSVAKVDGAVIPLGRAGYPANTSPFDQHHLFHDWAMANAARFDALLTDGERVVGEWLAQAHGTRYDLLTAREPFVAFDIIRGGDPAKGGLRVTVDELRTRSMPLDIRTPAVLATKPITPTEAVRLLGPRGYYGALDAPEGAVWRVERKGVVDFLVKYVRPDKVDGRYLPETEAGKVHGVTEPVWNWRPDDLR